MESREFISIIVPTFSEAERIGGFLKRSDGLDPMVGREILVADGGSFDGTPEQAEAHGIRVLRNLPRQRAAQMNAAARVARGDIFLFLHVDTDLVPGCLNTLSSTMRAPDICGGAFARYYDSPSWFLRGTCWLAAWRGRASGWFLGDQAIFVRRSVFEIIGGYPEQDLFEDLDFSRRMKRHGRVVLLRPPVLSSDRRFKACGPLRTTWSDFRMTLRHLRNKRITVAREGRDAKNASASDPSFSRLE